MDDDAKPQAGYHDLETFTREVRADRIRSSREYDVFFGTGMLDGRFPPDPPAHYEQRPMDAAERYLWWKKVLGTHFIEKPPAGLPMPGPVPPEPVEVKAIAPLPKPPAPEQKPVVPIAMQAPRTGRRFRRREPEPTAPVVAPKPEPPKDPYPQRTGPAPKPMQKKSEAKINGITYNFDDD
jgi:hypothetical protein